MRKLYFHNYTITPAIVTQVIHQDNEVIVRLLNITDQGLYNPANGLLKVGFMYPTPWGKLPVKGFEEGCAIF